jgi:hypothetical protein
MSQIFISHSARDKSYKDWINQAFASSNVNAKYEEIELLMRGTVTTEDVQNDIKASSAVFVLLSRNVEQLSHTRDWVAFEVGYAKGVDGGNKDVWVFENFRDLGHINMALPSFDHYIVYDTIDEIIPYVKSIIESYDDSKVLGNMVKGGSGGALLAANAATGFVGGAILGLLYSALSTNRPTGIEVICSNPSCRLKYRVHIPEPLNQFRCAKCNFWWLKP